MLHSLYKKFIEKADEYEYQKAITEANKTGKLILKGNDLQNVSDYKNLKKVTSAVFESNQISDFSFLAKWKKLEELTIEYNGVLDDLSFLSNLKSLKVLKLTNTGVRNLDFLLSMPKLETFWLYEYYSAFDLENTDALYSLKNLKNLKLHYSGKWLHLDEERLRKNCGKGIKIELF